MTDPVVFGRLVRQLVPRTAVVLGSGLAECAADVQEEAAISFADLPGLVPPTAVGHPGRILLGRLDGTPVLFFLGRLHQYEGHGSNALIRCVNFAADFGVRSIVLTNAAGGLNPTLLPGSLMTVRRHIKLLGPGDWRALARDRQAASRKASGGVEWPYSNRMMERLVLVAGQPFLGGVYAAVTGPCYETPAEIRALSACGVDAVGMSTVFEAEAAAELGLEVAAISCITNAAAGLGSDKVGHTDVLANARLGAARLVEVLRFLMRT